MNSEPGRDGTSLSMIAAFHSAIPLHLCKIYTSLLQDSLHPITWKLTTCILILTSRNEHKNEAKGYWPISLLKYIGKNMEKIGPQCLATTAQDIEAIGTEQM